MYYVLYLEIFLSPYPTFGKFHDVINMTPMELVKVAPQRTVFSLGSKSLSAEKC